PRVVVYRHDGGTGGHVGPVRLRRPATRGAGIPRGFEPPNSGGWTRYNRPMTRPDVTREDLTAALGARHELGDESDREVIESFLDRIGTAIDARVDRRLAEQDRDRHPRSGRQARGSIPLALG